MKIIATILSLYVLVLTAVPCVDVPHDEAEHNVELTHNPEGDDHEHIGHCSPFCTCLCCASPLIYQSFTILNSNFPLGQELYPKYQPAFITSRSANIWQPPRII